MRSFIREKKIYCGSDYLEVDLYQYTDAERDAHRCGKRNLKVVEALPKQVDWNDRNARRKFTWSVNANFGEGDYHVTLTYDDMHLPLTIENAERVLRNYFKRVSYARKKAGLPPMKYVSIPSCVYKADGVTPARIHHHVIMSGGLDRDVMEDLWRERRKPRHKKGEKIGYSNADRLQPGEQGLGALCEYLAKQAGGKKRWSPSRNLEHPEKEIIDSDTPERIQSRRVVSASRNLEHPWSRANDHRYSKRQVASIAQVPPSAEYWERRYPGYTLIRGDYGFSTRYSDVRGWAVYVKLRRIRN